MKSRRLAQRRVAVLAVFLILFGSVAQVSAMSVSEIIAESVQILREMGEQPDAESMSYLLERAKGVAIFPSVIKVGLMLGGRYGEGLVLRRDPETGQWFGPAFVEMKGLSYGIQFGVQSIALVLVITNERGLEGFQGGKITLGGDISVAAGPVGRHAEAKTDVDLEASIYSYSISKGVFAGMSLEGAVIDADEDANYTYWGTHTRSDQALEKRVDAAKLGDLIIELQTLMNEAI